MTTVLPTVLLAPVTVESAVLLTPSFVRVTFSGAGLADLDSTLGFDTRLKLVFPGATGELPPITGAAEDWYAAWMGMPDESRAAMRTYTIRDVLGEGPQRRLVVDFVVHDGATGPAGRWAAAARAGDVVHVIAPHRDASEYGGTEFAPGDLRDLLLAGDETAVPAIARILADFDDDYSGRVFIEVPTSDDFLDLPAKSGIGVRWLARNGRPHGRTLVQEVRSLAGLATSTKVDESASNLPSDLEVEVWETPRHSSAGEDVEAQLDVRAAGHAWAGTYVWIAGESWLVKALRRSFVTELGLERARVAFMGYWREGVSMRS